MSLALPCLLLALLVAPSLGAASSASVRIVAKAVKQEEVLKPVAPLSVFQTLACGGSARSHFAGNYVPYGRLEDHLANAQGC